MSDQEQQVESGAEAIQAGRDVTIYKGMAPEQMAQILTSMANQLAIYQNEAKEIVEQRIGALRDEILKRFADGKGANPEAFKDPDFQYVVSEAHKGYARSGDGTVRENLIDIIARRSLEKQRNRRAIALDEAAIKVPLMGKNEFSALSLAYLIRHTQKGGINNFDKFCKYLTEYLLPFVEDISGEESSYMHIESLSCGVLSDFQSVKLLNALKERYGGVLGKGFDRKQLEDHLPDGKKDSLDTYVLPCIHDKTKLQPNALNLEVFKKYSKESNLSEDELANVWTLFQSSIPNEEDVIELLRPHVPAIQCLFDAWKNTPVNRLKLTTIGIAIAHANAVRVVGFDAPLEIWIT